MSAKNHSRSPNKKNFSVALPKSLIAQLSQIAESETRSRNMQIERFLDEAVKEWMKKQNPSPDKVIPPIHCVPESKKNTNGKTVS